MAKKKAKRRSAARKWKGLSPIQRRVYEYIKVVERPAEIDQHALEQVRAMGDAGAQVYWEEKLLPGARAAAQLQAEFVKPAQPKKKRQPKKNPTDAKAILRNAMKGT